MTTDTDALTERIRAAMHDASPDILPCEQSRAAAVLPLVAVEVRKAKAEAWDEGYMEATNGDDDPLANPYRYETGDGDEHR